MHISSPDTTTISDHKLGATLAFLGFPCSWASTIQESTRQKHIQFFFESQSVRFPSLPDLHTLLQQWRGGQITDPHHLMNVCARAHHNYDTLLHWQKDGTPHLLRAVGSITAFRYERGPLPLTNETLVSCAHMQLVAALAEIGFQVHNILGEPRAHTYWLAPHGMPMIDSAGHPLRYDLSTVTRFAPAADDPRRLALEESQPMHPLVIAYNALRCRAWLKKQIDFESAAQTRLLIEDGQRQALIALNATGRVMDHVTSHFKSPPLP